MDELQRGRAAVLAASWHGQPPRYSLYLARRKEGSPHPRRIMVVTGATSWAEALEALGLPPVAPKNHRYRDQEMTAARREKACAAIRSVGKRLNLPEGTAPRKGAYDDHRSAGSPGAITIIRWAGELHSGPGGWSRTVAKLGLKAYTPAVRDFKATIRSQIANVASLLGLPTGVAPSLAAYEWGRKNHHPHYLSAWSVTKRLGVPQAWGKAVAKLGFAPASKARRPDKKQVREDLWAVAIKLGDPRRMPTERQYAALGQHTPTLALRVFGVTGWRALAVEVGLKMNRGASLAPDEMLESYRTACFVKGVTLTFDEFFDLRPPFSYHLVARHFGGWSKFVKAAGHTPRPRGGYHRKRVP